MNKIFIFFLLSNLLIQYIICDPKCTEATSENIGDLQCSGLATDNSNKKCIDNPNKATGQPLCVEKYCEEITAGAETELCQKLKNDTFTCSVSGTGDAAKCVATKIYCEDITKDATDDICVKFSNDTDKCGKTESKCLPTKYCEKVEYTDNVKCENYPAKTTDKKCHKDGNGCKEYTPADDKDGVNGLKISIIMLIILFLF